MGGRFAGRVVDAGVDGDVASTAAIWNDDLGGEARAGDGDEPFDARDARPPLEEVRPGGTVLPAAEREETSGAEARGGMRELAWGGSEGDGAPVRGGGDGALGCGGGEALGLAGGGVLACDRTGGEERADGAEGDWLGLGGGADAVPRGKGVVVARGGEGGVALGGGEVAAAAAADDALTRGADGDGLARGGGEGVTAVRDCVRGSTFVDAPETRSDAAAGAAAAWCDFGDFEGDEGGVARS